jgi:hypothetical protein
MDRMDGMDKHGRAPARSAGILPARSAGILPAVMDRMDSMDRMDGMDKHGRAPARSAGIPAGCLRRHPCRLSSPASCRQ